MTTISPTSGSLWDALASVPDHRRAEGKRYPLPSLLLIAVAALLAGRHDQLGIVRWGRRLSPEAFVAIGINLRLFAVSIPFVDQKSLFNRR